MQLRLPSENGKYAYCSGLPESMEEDTGLQTIWNSLRNSPPLKKDLSNTNRSVENDLKIILSTILNG